MKANSFDNNVAEIKKLRAEVATWRGRTLRAEERNRVQGKEIMDLRMNVTRKDYG